MVHDDGRYRCFVAMHCFGGWGGGRARGALASPSSASAAKPGHPPLSPLKGAAAAAAGAEEEERDARGRRRNESPCSSGALTSASAAASPTTINLTREYTLAVQTSSYSEIWSKIHHQHHGHHHLEQGEEPPSSSHLVAQVIHPDRESVEEALRYARPTQLTRLVSRYMDSSERSSHFFVSLRRSVDAARALYAPIADLLDLLPSPAPHLSRAQCDWAFDTLSQFHCLDNPFPPPSPSGSFGGMRSCFTELRQQLDARLLLARRTHRLLRRSTCGVAACLVGSAAGLAVAGLVIATHALAALVAGSTLSGCLPPRDLLEARRRRLRERMAQLDAAARGAYVLNNDIDTIERLVARLHATVESDKGLVRLGLERGRGHRHPIEEVLRQLRKNHPALVHQLRDLDEHVCLCFAAINRARSLLLQHLHHS